MKNKRVLVLGIALVLLALVVGVVFAAPREGYYHNNREEAIGITDLGNDTYYVVWFDRAGRQDFKAEARHVGNRLLYKIGGNNAYIELRNNRNIIYCARTNSEFTFSY
jgi:hypothetical protein